MFITPPIFHNVSVTSLCPVLRLGWLLFCCQPLNYVVSRFSVLNPPTFSFSIPSPCTPSPMPRGPDTTIQC